jgi:hypothetical protein
MRQILALAVPVVMLLAACGGTSAPAENSSAPTENTSAPTEISSAPAENKSAQFISEIRSNVPGSKAYDDDTLKDMATKVCHDLKPDSTIGETRKVLDSYSKLDKVDRALISGWAVHTFCPEKVPGS